MTHSRPGTNVRVTSSTTAVPMCISKENRFPSRDSIRKVFRPAPVVTRTFPPERPDATRCAAQQRVPLPESSLRLPSEFQSWIAASVSVDGDKIFQPSAPTPVYRSQIATATDARSSSPAGNRSRQVSRKSFFAPCAFMKGIVRLFKVIDLDRRRALHGYSLA